MTKKVYRSIAKHATEATSNGSLCGDRVVSDEEFKKVWQKDFVKIFAKSLVAEMVCQTMHKTDELLNNRVVGSFIRAQEINQCVIDAANIILGKDA